jgi:hypothetical protein
MMHRIEYKSWTPEELVKSWNKSGETKEFYGVPETEVWNHLDVIKEYAKDCELYFCSHCGRFVEVNYYIKTLNKCIECHTENWD